jgi:hypothetical protein
MLPDCFSFCAMMGVGGWLVVLVGRHAVWQPSMSPAALTATASSAPWWVCGVVYLCWWGAMQGAAQVWQGSGSACSIGGYSNFCPVVDVGVSGRYQRLRHKAAMLPMFLMQTRCML